MKKMKRRRFVIIVFLAVCWLGLLAARGEAAQPQASGRGFSLKLSGGLGLEVKLMSHVSLGLELFGRLADFGSWSGDFKETYTARKREGNEAEGWVSDETAQENYSESGPLWYYDSYADALDKYFGQMFIWQNKPDEPYNKNARQARINLDTMGVALSLRINFGL